MNFKSPAIRLSTGLVLLTVNLILLAHQIGLLPNAAESALEMRKTFSESLALQLSDAAERGEIQTIQDTLRTVVERNEKIRSAAIRTQSGELIALAGEHLAHWQPGGDTESTPTHVQVPIFRESDHWATVQVRYAPLWADHLIFGFHSSFLLFLLFVGLFSFLLYVFILKRTLRELDPSAVIPERVRSAFDVLQEGVIILDDQEQILMANVAFAALLGKTPDALVGVKGSELGWLNHNTPQQLDALPWMRVLKAGIRPDNQTAPLRLMNAVGSKIKLSVTAAAVTDSAGNCRGCIVTFDDMTQLEEKNFELNHLLTKLKSSNAEIKTKSRELEFLANRDPLTLCLNRRAMDRNLASLFAQARADDGTLCCIMADIDRFKSVNDRYGHATGDRVIKAVADVLKSCTRDSDLVARYGGEEYCVVLTGVELNQAKKIAERMRRLIEKKACANVHFTASLGLACLRETILDPEELVNRADKALYVAKESGRNRVVVWADMQKVSDRQAVTPADGASGSSGAGAAEAPADAAPTAERQVLERRIAELEGEVKKRGLELEHAILYDPRTGLPSRQLFEDRITHEIARGQRTDSLVVVLAMVIDTIKRIEETLGAGAAKQLVKSCGMRLNDVLRENIDMVAVIEDSATPSSISLLSQTEFGILLPDIQKVDHVTWIIKRLTDAFEQPFRIQGQEIYTTPYLGVGIYPYDGQEVEELHRSAINACRYAQQEQGNARYQFASQRLNAEAIQQLRIENALRNALSNGEFELHYQPQIEAASGRVAKLEALLRWRNPQLGQIPPDQFIPVAEYSGLIDTIGDWVIGEALRQLRQWLDEGFAIDAVGVNLSGIQLRQPNLAAKVQKQLLTWNLEPHQLEIELTESSLVGSKDSAVAVLKRLRSAGVQVAMDDFGTGYSSLAYIKDIPLSSIKIDRSFTAGIGEDPQAEKLIASIISMAHKLDLLVVAEGIESADQAEFLSELGCEFLQGYHLGRPSPASSVADQLDMHTETASVA